MIKKVIIALMVLLMVSVSILNATSHNHFLYYSKTDGQLGPWPTNGAPAIVADRDTQQADHQPGAADPRHSLDQGLVLPPVIVTAASFRPDTVQGFSWNFSRKAPDAVRGFTVHCLDGLLNYYEPLKPLQSVSLQI